MLAVCHVIQLCSLLKVFNTLRSVEESLDTRLENHKLLYLKTAINNNQLTVKPVCHQVNVGIMPSILMIPCGMVKVVVQLAHATHSTIHHGFVNNYLTQLMLIWKSDCAQLILYVLKTLQ